MPVESGEEEDVELIGGAGRDSAGEEGDEEKTSYAGHYPLPGTVPKGIEDRLTTWLNRSESKDAYEARKWTRELNNYAYHVAAERVGAGLGEAEMKAFLKQYPKLPVDAVFEWNAAFLRMTDGEEKINHQDDLWEALDGTLYLYSSDKIENPWLVDYYFGWKPERRRRDELIIGRREWVALTARVEREFDAVAGEIWQIITVPILKPICPGMRDAYKKHMARLREEKPEDAMKMEAFGGRRL